MLAEIIEADTRAMKMFLELGYSINECLAAFETVFQSQDNYSDRLKSIKSFIAKQK